MSIKIKTIQSTGAPAWDAYVHAHPQATLYHLSGWEQVISKTYGHKTYYLMAINSSKLKAQCSKDFSEPYELPATGNELSCRGNSHELSAKSYELNANAVVGILPLVHLKHFLFGNNLISIPFFDLGGILADDEDAEKALLSEAIQLGEELKVNSIELRHITPLSWLSELNRTIPSSPMNSSNPLTYKTKSHKVRMLHELPESSEVLMKSFKSKLRSQIKKSLKQGLNFKIGGSELLADFYKVFSINMRDLGSPVHPKKLMQNVLKEFPQNAKIVMVYKDDHPLACSMIVGFNNTLENPWASALREYSRLSPNMLLYWAMLEYACDNGFTFFDFGRSSPDEGTYKFKEQWGAKPYPLHWQYVSLNGKPVDEDSSEKSKFQKAIRYWQKLPVPVTKVVGPRIRKYIGL